MTDRTQQAMTPLHHALRQYSQALDQGDVLAAMKWEEEARGLVAHLKATKVRLPVELDPLLRAAAKGIFQTA